jgi:toxin ParE1/3/4
VQVIWTQRAIRHLVDIRSYIERDKPEAARRVAERLILASEYLAVHPHKGRPGRKAGTRELIIPNTPYILPYRVHEETLTILSVLHAAQQR